MARRKKGVVINVDMDFFDRRFEPARKELEKQLGVRVSQTTFTHLLDKQNISLKINLENAIKRQRKNKKR